MTLYEVLGEGETIVVSDPDRELIAVWSGGLTVNLYRFAREADTLAHDFAIPEDCFTLADGEDHDWHSVRADALAWLASDG